MGSTELGVISLFGGAASIRSPFDLLDASDARPVPDNQEVFLQRDGPASVIIEIVEMPTSEEDAAAGIMYYVRDCAAENGTPNDFVVHDATDLAPWLPESGCSARFVQLRASARAKVGRSLLAHMTVIRVPQLSTDILITVNNAEDPRDARLISDSLSITDWSLFT